MIAACDYTKRTYSLIETDSTAASIDDGYGGTSTAIYVMVRGDTTNNEEEINIEELEKSVVGHVEPLTPKPRRWIRKDRKKSTPTETEARSRGPPALITVRLARIRPRAGHCLTVNVTSFQTRKER